MDRETVEFLRGVLTRAVDEADAELIEAIRRNNGVQSRGALLSQLDVLETVRERLNVGFDRITRDDA